MLALVFTAVQLFHNPEEQHEYFTIQYLKQSYVSLTSSNHTLMFTHVQAKVHDLKHVQSLHGNI